MLAQLVAHFYGTIKRAGFTAYANKNVLLKYFHDPGFQQEADSGAHKPILSIFSECGNVEESITGASTSLIPGALIEKMSVRFMRDRRQHGVWQQT